MSSYARVDCTFTKRLIHRLLQIPMTQYRRASISNLVPTALILEPHKGLSEAEVQSKHQPSCVSRQYNELIYAVIETAPKNADFQTDNPGYGQSPSATHSSFGLRQTAPSPRIRQKTCLCHLEPTIGSIRSVAVNSERDLINRGYLSHSPATTGFWQRQTWTSVKALCWRWCCITCWSNEQKAVKKTAVRLRVQYLTI